MSGFYKKERATPEFTAITRKPLFAVNPVVAQFLARCDIRFRVLRVMTGI